MTEQLTMSFDEPVAPPADVPTTQHASSRTAGLDDQAARDRMAADVGRRVVAVAGAGSGKTTQLVKRVLTTLAGDAATPAVPASQVAVITFTDKAARELVHRLRSDAPGPIDDAHVGTIHGFCASILRSFPIEAGLPPKFSTADEITSRTDAEARSREIVGAVYDRSAHDPELREALAVVAANVGLQSLLSIVAVIDQRWDRFEQLHLSPPSVAELTSLRAAALDCGDAFLAGRPKSNKTVDGFIASLEALRARELDLPRAVRVSLPSLGNAGGGDLKGARDAIKDACAAINSTARTVVLHRLVAAFQPLVLERAAQRIANGQLGYDDLLVLTRRLLAEHEPVRRELRKRYQRVFVDEFQDTDRVQFEILQLLTAPDVGEAAAASPRLFAVGDPKQSIYGFRQAEVELFSGLAADAAAGGYLAELTSNFRTRANVAGWINTVMQRRFDLPLTSATKRKDLDEQGLWPPPVPVAYEPLAPERPATIASEVAPGPAVVLLGVDEGDSDEAGAAPLVARAHESAELAQRAEATDIVGIVRRVESEGWRVLEEAKAPNGARSWTSRVARRRDIAVLVARRTGLGELEDTLRRAGIPYRVEGGTLAYDRREVYELLRVLRAVSNPADELHLVTALRTSILGCSDTDLFAYRHRQGTFKGTWRVRTEHDLPAAPAPGDERDAAGIARVRRALAQIDGWSRDAHRRGPAVLLADIYDWSMGVAAAQFEGAHMVSETWRRVRYLIDEARAWTDETAGTLPEYLAWVADKVETVERSEIAPDETDEDAVRILTIHAAKGLQFPIVVVAGLGTKDNFMADQFRVMFTDEGAELKLGALATPGFPGRDDIAAWAEEARLLYVAMTRTQDHLVVSCHTSERSNPNPTQRLAGHLEPAGAELWQAAELVPAPPSDLPTLADLRLVDPSQPVTAAELLPRPPADRRTIWTPSALAAREHDVAEGAPAEDDAGAFDPGGDAGPAGVVPPADGSPSTRRRRPPDAIDGVPRDPGLQRDPPSGLDALRSRGRYGTDAGKAVHEVMQRVDLADPSLDLQALVDAACDNVDLVEADQRERVRQLAMSIIDSALFTRMRTATVCEREIYVGAQADVDGQPSTIWGYADAVFQTETGAYAVVDFKTDSSATTPDELRDRYSAQLNAYAEVIERATGGAVGELWLLVGRTGAPADEIAIPRR
jgi:ATP-dependent exoDNAse (exonuclease V) beta subunit